MKTENHTVKNTFEVWIEGYDATGEHQPCSFLGNSSGYNFEDACIALFGDALDRHENGELNRHNGQPAIWGCACYPTEEKARRREGMPESILKINASFILNKIYNQ